MAFTPNRYLRQNTSTTLRDPQHAARLFVDDQFRLAPKHKFLFHVAFNINPAALSDPSLVQRHRNEINMLVKSADLPNFTVQTETLNQYNRKKNVQTTMKYNAINITFHDDNMGLVNYLWQNYYSYYYADPLVANDPSAYNRTATKNGNYIKTPYGLDNGSTLPFFNYIVLYQMARHEYVSYTLYNPIITSWNHNKLDSSSMGVHDNAATIAYEAVSYASGDVVAGDPEGFGFEHYDTGSSSLQGTPLAGSQSPSFVNNNDPVNPVGILNTLAEQLNTYQNSQQKSSPATAGIINAAISSPSKGVSGLQGVAFPTTNQSNTDVTTATQVKL
jgi:hypothetical protein